MDWIRGILITPTVMASLRDWKVSTMIYQGLLRGYPGGDGNITVVKLRTNTFITN